VVNTRNKKLTSKPRGTSGYQLNCFFCVLLYSRFSLKTTQEHDRNMLTKLHLVRRNTVICSLPFI